MPPFFSIGVTTYNRPALLARTLQSIARQTFLDFEVLIGNDYVAEPLVPERLGIDDARFLILNHPRNLGEAGNMNALLFAAKGRYFTWMADDDLYAPRFLEAAHAALASAAFVPCAFTAFRSFYGPRQPVGAAPGVGSSRVMSGRAFWDAYRDGALCAIGTYGVYEVEALRRDGGIQRLTPAPVAFFSEYALLLRTALMERIVYVDAPLVYYRGHDESRGCTNEDVRATWEGGQRFVARSLQAFQDPALRGDFRRNIQWLLRLVLGTFMATLIAHDRRLDRTQFARFQTELERLFQPLKEPLRQAAFDALREAERELLRTQWYHVARAWFMALAPKWLIKLARSLVYRTWLFGED